MIRSTGPLGALEVAAVEWTEPGEPRSKKFADVYFSHGHGDAEKEHTFIAGSQLADRLAAHPRERFVVGELGFGSGLNFLATWRALYTHAKQQTGLHYWSLDLHPLEKIDLQRILERFPQFENEAAALLEAYPPPLPGVHRRVFADGRITLDMIWAEAESALQELSSLDRPLVDSWYLDGFAPARNADMWQDTLFKKMAASSHSGASVATYSAAQDVQIGLKNAGFSISKRLGYGLKRDNIQGQLASRSGLTENAVSELTPWDLARIAAPPVNERVLVIGAGLAGAHVAAALARRGKEVQVLDGGGQAQQASGNAQGVLFTRLSHQRSTLTDFSILAFLYARDLYRHMFDRGVLRRNIDGELSGCFQSLPEQPSNAALHTALGGLEELARIATQEEASGLLGTRVNGAGVWQPGSGWLSPPAVCAALLASPGIGLIEHCEALSLEHTDGGVWEAKNPDGEVLASAGTAIIAAGSQCRDFAQLAGLPLKVVRGQTTQIPAPESGQLKHAYCHRGYIAPAVAGQHCIGATFLPGDEDRGIRVTEHEQNLQALADALPNWRAHLEQLDARVLQGKAALRCVSPDYLPLAGPVPHAADFMQCFAALGTDARQVINSKGDYLPHLYLSTAYGSRGLSYAALSGELIASQICAEPIPMSRELQRAVAPARFLIRGIIRGTV